MSRLRTSSSRVALVLAAAFGIITHDVRADDFPSKPVTLIIPFTPGGPTDVAMRAIADAASKSLGQSILIESRPGGGGATAPINMAATAKPDGYTIAQMPQGVFRLPLMQKMASTPDDFTYIIHLTGYVFGTVSSAKLPFSTWDGLVEYAKKNPGKLTYGSSGIGGGPHIGMEAIADKVGIKLTHVPFPGTAGYTNALLGGHIDLAAGGGNMREAAADGKVHFLNVWTAERVPTLPDVPTLKEQGIPFVIDSPFGIAGPKGMDPAVVKKLHDAFKIAIEDPKVQAILAKMDMIPRYMNGADYRKSIDEFVVTETALLKRLGLYQTSK